MHDYDKILLLLVRKRIKECNKKNKQISNDKYRKIPTEDVIEIMKSIEKNILHSNKKFK